MCWTINSELFKMCSFKMGIKGERLISSLVLSHTQMSQCPVKILLQPPILLEGCVVKFQFLLFVFTCIAYKVLRKCICHALTNTYLPFALFWLLDWRSMYWKYWYHFHLPYLFIETKHSEIHCTVSVIYQETKQSSIMLQAQANEVGTLCQTCKRNTFYVSTSCSTCIYLNTWQRPNIQCSHR